jgi:peptide chain release factor subunit 3
MSDNPFSNYNFDSSAGYEYSYDPSTAYTFHPSQEAQDYALGQEDY